MQMEKFTLSTLNAIEKQETEGIWRHYYGSFYVKIARYMGANFQAKIRKMNKKQRDQLEKMQNLDDIGGIIGEEKVLVAELILIDWKGLYDDDGNEIPYSREKAIENLGNQSFYREVIKLSMEYDEYKTVQEEDDKGNL
jgi:hypothetical protein